MPGPPSFDSTRGDTVVPRERSDTPGDSSSSGLVHLTPGPGAFPPRNLTEEPTVAHIPDSDDSGYVIMHSQKQDHDYELPKLLAKHKKRGLPTFLNFQPGIPPDRCISAHLPRANRDKH